MASSSANSRGVRFFLACLFSLRCTSTTVISNLVAAELLMAYLIILSAVQLHSALLQELNYQYLDQTNIFMRNIKNLTKRDGKHMRELLDN